MLQEANFMAGHLVHALAQNSTDVSSGMIYMLLNICCSVSISLILKFHESRRGSRMVALAGNYIVAAAINLLLWWGMGFAVLNSTAILLGIGVGVLFVLTFWLIMISIGRTGVAITVSVSRLAVVMPVAAAVIFFGERLSVFYIPGLILGLVSFVLFGQAANREETAAKHSWNRWLLLFVFLSMGITGISIQSYEQYFPAEQRSGFLTLVFGVAMICAWFMVLQRREKIRASDMKLGLIMGIPNGLSAFFFMSAIHYLPDIVIFPVNDVAVVLFSTLGAFLIWREKLNRTGWIALALAVAAIALMNIKLTT